MLVIICDNQLMSYDNMRECVEHLFFSTNCDSKCTYINITVNDKKALYAKVS